MIKKNELRIGNFFYYYEPLEQNKQILRVTDINEDGVEVYFVGSKEYASVHIPTGIMPIQLTPEILEKCGFKNFPRPDDNERKMIDLFFLNIGTMDITFHMGETLLIAKSGQVILNKSILYLHRLQNLYFDLADKELEINL